ncbi:MAG: Bax inhibitor-1/YccA family protein [Gammaproteobacteria bacterium]|jgi:modulator of FtsH protease|nr:Bax inhibitor-1/YccA family protein [Gammaproteobacteria bacterium]
MSNQNISYTSSQASVLSTNKVLRNTYALLSMTLLFSALTAGVSMVVNPPHFISLVTSIAAIGLIWFVLPKTANSSKGLYVVFAFAGLMGFGLGPILNTYLNTANGGQIIMTALGGTGIIFLALSAYALTTRKDFSFMGGMLMVGLIVVLIAAIANIFLAMPALSLTISAVVILLMSGFILFDTGRIINGGETNYIMATVSLYLNIYNIFVSLLQLLGIFGSDD